MRLVRSGLRLFVGLSFLALPTATSLIRPAAAADKSPDPKRPYGLEKRVLWTTSRVQGSPDPASPFHTESAFPKLKFDEPIAMAHAPGSDRVYLLQRFGKLLSFPNNPTVEKNELVLDVKKEVLGLTLHPGFEKNGYVFIASLTVAADAQPRTVRVSRFKVDQGESPRSDAKSELVLIEWPSLYHDGCCLVFGRDGYLYISAGDGGGPDNGQGLGDLSSSIMRIDVDHAEGDRPYAIPPDNPFIGLAGARPEVWAYGLRNPWRFSIDRVTGDLWTGDVGQDLWELVYLVQRGGNYGWNVREGNHPYQPYRKQGPTPILPPIVEHTHAEARSITGGYVYRGSRLKDLIGAYVYGDYDTGKIWALRYDGQKVLWHKEIAETNHRIVAFDEDNAGELYIVDHMGGSVNQLVPSPPSADPQNFPRKLSETGLFESIRDLRPAPGLIPYTVNAPLWSDGGTKERYLALPGDSKIEYDAMLFPGDETTPGKGWKFPAGTVLVKTFFLDLEKGNPARRIRLETRLLHHKRLVGREEFGDQFWRGYTYIWNDEQTDATLLENPNGLDRTFTIRDTDAPGGSRQQTWHFLSRTECMVCHTVPAKFVLGVNTMQMNRDFDYGGVVDNQIRSWEHIGLFTKPLPKPPEELPKLADYRDKSKDLESRARAYLHVNCSNCHRGFGGGNANFQLLATDPLAQMGIIDAPPTQGTFGIPDARVVAPGAPDRSIIVHRMSTREAGKMPPLASSVIDQEGLQLIRDWIRGLPVEKARAAKR
jgi:uncharacterized repeat protein (TIGR03806 family)